MLLVGGLVLLDDATMGFFLFVIVSSPDQKFKTCDCGLPGQKCDDQDGGPRRFSNPRVVFSVGACSSDLVFC